MTASLRQTAEDIFADELAGLAKADTRERPANWKLSPQAVVTYLMGGKAGRRYGDLAQICRQPATDRDRGRDARDRSRAAAARRARHGEVVGVGASGGRASPARPGALVQCTAGTDENQIRYGWNYAQLLAQGPVARGAGADAADARHGGRHDRALRGAHAHGLRRAGHADHGAVGEDAADPRAQQRGATRSAAST